MRPAVATLIPLAFVTGPGTISTGAEPEAPSDFHSMLDLVPASTFELGGNAFLSYIDMEAVWALAGVGPDRSDREEHLGDVAIDTGLPQLFQNMWRETEGAEAEVGFSTLDIQREIAVRLPPQTLIIDVVDVDRDQVVAALESNPTWSPHLQEVESEHGDYYSWGDGSTPHPDRRSPLRMLGQAGELAVLGESMVTTVRTLDPLDMEAALATAAGEEESLATGLLLGPVIERLDDDTVLQALSVPSPTVATPPIGASPELIEELLQQSLRPYLGVTIVELVSDTGRTSEVLLVHADAETASINAELAEQLLATGIEPMTGEPLADLLPDATVNVDGNVVSVVVPGEGMFRVLGEMLFNRALFPTG
jgi:hypothetical protein